MSESIIQTHTSSLLEKGGGRGERKGGRGKRRKEGIKAGVAEESRDRGWGGGGVVSRLLHQSICSIKMSQNAIRMSACTGRG